MAMIFILKCCSVKDLVRMVLLTHFQSAEIIMIKKVVRIMITSTCVTRGS